MNNIFEDERGSLLPINLKEIPFDVKRVFTVYNVPKDTVRGDHAHYKTKQYLICVKGMIKVILETDKNKTTETILEKGDSIFIDKLVWDSQQFLTNDDVMLVFASTEYNLEDYILDKNIFYNIINKKLK
tara:strand:+ start:616 stop:1002 length:387 start_codon:yes stop_codon:yes gene_type:complete